MKNTFRELLEEEIESNRNNDFPPEPIRDAVKTKSSLKAKLLKFVFTLRGQLKKTPEIEEYFSRFDNLFGLLADSHSKDLLIKLVAFRKLGQKKYRLPRFYDRFHENVDDLKKHIDYATTVKVEPNRWVMGLANIKPLGFDISLYSTPIGIYVDFVLQQYRYKNGNTEIKANEGDVVLDLGGFTGDTALYFSHLVGATGKVFSFEFIPSNLKILEKNLSLNNHLSSNIKVVKRPVWIKPGLKIYFTDKGPASRLKTAKPLKFDGMCESVSIDDFVRSEKLEKVDFIKMDIEGAELPALKGAESTIRRFKPNLAIAVYHSLDDFVNIPAFIDSLDLKYRFYLDHFTTGKNETILYCTQN